MTLEQPRRDTPRVDDVVVRAALADIAAELEASEGNATRSRSRVAWSAAAVIVIALVVAVARWRSSVRRDNAAPFGRELDAAGEINVPPAMAPARAPTVTPPTAPAAQSALPISSAPVSRLPRDTSPARDDATKKTSPAIVSTVEIAPSTARVTVSRTTALVVTLHDENGNEITGRRVAWSSNKPRVATVSSRGVVRGRSAGTATITARSGKHKATAVVVVTRPPAKTTRR
jgi:uncharacterized protein YjdB